MKLLSDPWVQVFGCIALLSGALSVHAYGFPHLKLPALRLPALGKLPLGGPSAAKAGGKWLVDPAGGGDAKTIAAAVQAARPGDEIVLSPGVYTEAVSIEKALTIKAQGAGASTIESPGGTAVLVKGGPVVFWGVSVTIPSSKGAAFWIARGTVSFSGAKISGGETALLVEGAGSALKLADAQLAGGGRGLDSSSAWVSIEGCEFSGASESGVRARDRARLFVSKSRFIGNGRGVLAIDGAKAELRDSTVTGATLAGLSAARGAEISDMGSSLEGGGGPGVYADERSMIKLDRTTISRPRSDGAHLAKQSMMVLHKVKIVEPGGAGVIVTQGSEAFFSDSEVRGAGRCGIEVYSNSSASLDRARINDNQCGVGFYGEGRLQSQDGDFTANAKGPLVYAERWKSKIFLKGNGNQPDGFQELFR